MNNFTYHVPTEIHFGAGQLSHLSQLTESGSRVLLVYGGGSIRRSGLYDQILSHLTAAELHVTELSGVDPNPRIATVRRGAALCRDGGIDMVLAVGGGSAIDCAKMVAAGTLYNGDPWDLILDSGKIQGALPIYCVPTLASTGSEMDAYAVISNPETQEKPDVHSGPNTHLHRASGPDRRRRRRHFQPRAGKLLHPGPRRFRPGQTL